MTERFQLMHGDCLQLLRGLPDACVDAIVTDPPASISFMGKAWDSDRGGRAQWTAWLAEVMSECLRCLKPGGYSLTWAIPRRSHWTAIALEDAGFHITDRIAHLFGSGFPKGRGQLKPACEDWWLCRKPGAKALPLGIEECRVGKEGATKKAGSQKFGWDGSRTGEPVKVTPIPGLGRWPANLVIDDSDEVQEAFAAFGESKSKRQERGSVKIWSDESRGHVGWEGKSTERGHDDSGTSARFFYCAKSSRRERNMGLEFEPVGGGDGVGVPIRNTHPT